MCYLCDEIYTKEGREIWLGMAMNAYDGMPYIYKQEEVETKGLNGKVYNDYYYLGFDTWDFHYSMNKDFCGEDEFINIRINYCPKCGKQLFFSKCFNEPIRNNPKVKRIIKKEN